MPFLDLRAVAERRSFLDPHGGKVSGSVKSGLARAAIVDVGRDPMNRYWVLDSWAARVGTDAMIGKMVEHYEKWNPGAFGIDSTGQQSLFVDTVTSYLRLRGVRMAVVPVPAPTHGGNKLYRIRTVLQPVIAEHRLFVGENQLELLAELAAFPTGKTVDLVDALAGAISMFPQAVTAEEQEEAGDNMYKEFLQECGLPDEEIDARLKETP